MVRAIASVARCPTLAWSLSSAVARVAVALFPGLFLLASAQAESQRPEHWAYQVPLRPGLPELRDLDWERNSVDAFCYARMRHHSLTPNPAADRTTFIRRVTLGLTGLPPTLAEIDAYLADPDPAASERLVERLLASPRFGERMATPWLDLARYADSHGYHMDAHREMSAWRDWVIDALNDNLPFDQFTVDQLAGDLLPNATPAQVIASGFNRNNMVNFENGALAEEYLVEYAVDRTVTTSTVWMGQTMQCARCHDHKHDPFTQRDFYQLLAFFNQVPEKGIDGDQGNASPFVPAPSLQQRQRREELVQQLARCDELLAQRATDCDADLAAWEQTLARQRAAIQPPADMLLHLPLDEVVDGTTVDQVSGDRLVVSGPTYLAKTKFGRGLLFGGETIVESAADSERDASVAQSLSFKVAQPFSAAAWVYPTTNDRMTVLAKQSAAPMLRGYCVELHEGQVHFGVTNDQTKSRIQVRTNGTVAKYQWHHVTVTYDGSSRASGVRIYLNGERQELATLDDDLQGSITTTQPLRIGGGMSDAPFRGGIDEVRIYSRVLTATEVGLLAGGDPVSDIVAIKRSQRSQRQHLALRTYFLQHHDARFQALGRKRDAAARALMALEAAIPTSMVMRETDSTRPTFILSNGQYDSPAELVAPAAPAVLPPLATDVPRNRLGLARWLVDPRHPLTARVAVNRIWQLHFGTGLVSTPEDFGTRGAPPTHPQLLDWLATELIRTGWDTKQIHRLIVTSATYRQASRPTAAEGARDPNNRWLARGPRGRLAAEVIRDQALAASGLLVEQLGGPSVFPYQPAGLWKELSYDANEFTAQVYQPDHGSKLYRRSLYTFWKRSVPSPALATLGAPNRETCVVRRSPTNTPLEALVLMNETAFFEAARKLAERILETGGKTDERRLDWAFRTTAGRTPTPDERVVLQQTLDRQRAIFRASPESSLQLLSIGESPARSAETPSELAAWTMVANLLFCLDETITTH